MEDENKYSFIVIGKTGAGKSSILNSLVGETKFPEGADLKSTTKEVCEYVGKLKHDKSTFNIIDTPGFYDSDKEDNNHINNIVRFMKSLKQFGGINCIFYVISLTEQRFDCTIQTCLSLLRSLLGDDVFKKIKFIYTHKNDLSEKAYLKSLHRFRDLPQLLMTSGFPVDENLETFIYDYDEPEDFCKKVIASTKQSAKFYPEVLKNLDSIDFDMNDPVEVYKKLVDNSKFIASLNDQLNELEEVIKLYQNQCVKFEEEKKFFAKELKKKEDEMRQMLEQQATASENNKKEMTKMIQSYSYQMEEINKAHLKSLHDLRVANELEIEKIRESQERFRIEQEKIRRENEERIRRECEARLRRRIEEERIANELATKLIIESNERKKREEERNRRESEERIRRMREEKEREMQKELKALRERPPQVIHSGGGGGGCNIL